MLENALTRMYKRNIEASAKGEQPQIRAEVGEKDVHIYCLKKVVMFVDDPNTEIALSNALKIDPGAKTGDYVEEEVTPSNFGRMAAHTARFVLESKIKDYERERDIKQFQSRVGDIINTHVSRFEGKLVFVDPDGQQDYAEHIEALLPPEEQIRSERFRVREMLKVYVLELRENPGGRSRYQLVVSRTHPSLVRRLVENEVEEIASGKVQIVSIAREPGIRTKIAVTSADRNIDPVGACLGSNASRLKAILRELRGEKLDIVKYDEDPVKYIIDAVAPAHVVSVDCDTETRTAVVRVPDKELSLAIGKKGVNAKLSAKLTGWNVKIQGTTE